MSLGECVYSCRHPLWGGEGTCITDDDDATGGDRCECDEGFVSCDSFGSPSCVSKKAITWLYVVMTAVGAMATLFFLCHLERDRHMQEIARHAPKAVIRKRMLISLSLSAGAATVMTTVAWARGGEASLWDGGMFYLYFSFAFPLIMFASVQLVELWLNCLPSQMVTPGSTMAKIKRDGEEKQLFVWMGVSNMVFASLIGPLSMVFRQRRLITALHISTLFSSPLMIGAIITVAVNITNAINKAGSQARQAWHKKAKRTIRKQVCVLAVVGTTFNIAAGMLELSEIGRRTPIIPFMAMCFIGMGGLMAAVHFSRPAAEKLSSPALSTMPKFFSSPLSSPRVFSGKMSPASPGAILAKASSLLTPRGLSGTKSPPARVTKSTCKDIGDAKVEGGHAWNKGGEVDAATTTVPRARRASRESRASKDKLPGVGRHCQKVVPTVSLDPPA